MTSRAELFQNRGVLALDRSVLEELRGLESGNSSDGLVQELIGLFFKAVPERLQNIQLALKASDLTRIRKEAHALKSSAASLGALRLAASCKELELQKEFDEAIINAFLINAQRQFEEVCNELQHERSAA